MRSATAGRLLRGASEKGRLEIRVGGRGASVSPGQKPSCSRKSTDWSPCGRETKFSRCRHSRQCSVSRLRLRSKARVQPGEPCCRLSTRSSGSKREAAALRASIVLPDLPVFPAAALAAVGLSERDIEQIRAVLAAYDRTNAMALIALSALHCKIAGTGGEHDSAVEEHTEASASSQAKLMLPSLLSLAE